MSNYFVRSHRREPYTTVDLRSTPVHAICATLLGMKLVPEIMFAERLKAACLAAGIPADPTPLGKRVGMKKAVCSKYLTGKTKMATISAAAVYALSDGLKCNARWLFTGLGEMHWTAARSQDETEVLHCMRHLSPQGRAHVLDDARAQIAKEHQTPLNSGFFPSRQKHK